MLPSYKKNVSWEDSKELVPLIEILKTLGIEKENFNSNHTFYSSLKKYHQIIFPDNKTDSLNKEENQKKWKDFLDFIKGADFSFIQKLLNSIDNSLGLNPETLDRLIILIQKMGVKRIDFFKKLKVRLESYYIDDLGTFNDYHYNELPLPQELKPFNKKSIAFAEFNADYFQQIINLSFLFSKKPEHEKILNLMMFLISKDLLNFSIFTNTFFSTNLKEKAFVNANGKVFKFCEEILEEVDFNSFTAWLNDWKEKCGITEKEDGSGFQILEPLTEQQTAIQHLVREGFSEEYTKKAFAQYAINKKQSIFVDDRVSLRSSRIPNNLLVYFIQSLPKEMTKIVFDHVLEDKNFSAVIDALKGFQNLENLVITQQNLSNAKKEKLCEIFNSQTNPKLKSIRYLPNEKNKNDDQYLKDIDFLKTLAISISADIPDDPNDNQKKEKKETKETELFEYHQELMNHEKLVFNTHWTPLFRQSGVIRVFHYLRSETAISKITEITGDISKLNDQDFQEFLNILSNLTNLKTLSLTYSDKCKNIDEKEKKIRLQIASVQFTWQKKEDKQHIRPQALPNETLDTALFEIQETLKLREKEEQQSADENALVDPLFDKEIATTVSSSFSSEEEQDTLKKMLLSDYSSHNYKTYQQQLILKKDKDNRLTAYINHFFETVIQPVLSERERLIELLKKELEPSLFSIKFSREDDIHLLCQKIDVLSGFLDRQEEKLAILTNPDATHDTNKAISEFSKQLQELTDFKTESKIALITLNPNYRKNQLGKLTNKLTPFQEQDKQLNFSTINKARSSVGMFLKNCVGYFLIGLSSNKTEETHKKYQHYFFTHTADVIKKNMMNTDEKNHHPSSSVALN